MHAMVGNRSGETHRLGDRVTVKLVEAAPVAGALRFELLSEGRVMTGAQRRPSDRPAAGPARSAAREEAVSRQEAVSWKAPMTEIPPELMQKFSTDAMGGHPNVTPKDASTLILLDRSGAEPKVLMGKRHDRHVFMPGAYVFPGGRVDPIDREHAGRGIARSARRAEADGCRSSARAPPRRARWRSPPIRETFEETGLLLGAKASETPAQAGQTPGRPSPTPASCPTSPPCISSPAP